MRRFVILCCLAAAPMIAHRVLADDAPASQPSTEPAAMDPTDTDKLLAADGQTVTVEGEVAKANWTKENKRFFIDFKGIDRDKGLTVTAAGKDKEKLDAGFDGDIAAKLKGAKVRITGKLEKYKDKPEIIILGPEQITIVEPAK